MATRQSGGRVAKNKNQLVESAEQKVQNLLADLPDPEDLAKYEKIIPGGAERILEMAELQARHQQEVEVKAVITKARTANLKQVTFFILALAAGVLGGALMLMGSELAGLIIMLIDAVTLVGIAVYGKD